MARPAPTHGRTVSGSSKRQAGSSHNRRLRRSATAAAAGVSRSTLYRHFPGRKGLIAALGERPRKEGSQGRGAVPARAPWTRAACSPGRDPRLRRGCPLRSSGADRRRSAAGRESGAGTLCAGHRRFPSSPGRGTRAAPGAPRGTAGRRPGTRLRRSLGAPRPSGRLPRDRGRAAVATRKGDRGDAHARSTSEQPRRDRSPGGSGHDLGGSLHGRIRTRHASQAADACCGDSAEPPSAPNQQNHGRRSRGQRDPELRGGR